MTRTVIVCGGRIYADKARVYAVLDEEHAACPITLICHGGASGADRFAHDWVQDRACSRELPYLADWDTHGRAAGPIRNEKMAREGADLCIAFPGGRGTADMMQRARAYGITVREIAP